MFTFYRKLLFRQSRSRAMHLFCFSVATACAVTFSITLLGDRLEQLFKQQAKEVIAADLALQSTTPLSQKQKDIIDTFSLRTAQTLSFQTMASAGDAFMLSSVKAVSEAYPLLGALQVSNEIYGEVEKAISIPEKGEVWVEDRVLNEMGLKLKQEINVGEKTFKIARILVFEPDRGNSFYSFTPRIMMNWADVPATQVVKPGSRVKYRYLFSGDEIELNNIKTQLASSLQLNQEFISIESANQTLATTLERAYRFLHITALIAVLLGAVAAALVSYQYANEMTYEYALLRCIGLQGKKMFIAVIAPFAIYSLISIAIGLLAGLFTHILMLRGLSEIFSVSLPAASYKPLLLSAFTALIVVFSFAWPFMKKLTHSAPKQLLNRFESQKQPILFTILTMFFGLSILIYVGTKEILISVYIIGLLFFFIMITYLITRFVINIFMMLSRSASITTKLTARNLKANRSMVALQVIAIAITFFSLALISTIHDDLVASWQSKVPDDAPNIFAINLFPTETQEFKQILLAKNIIHSPFYPIIRGRLSAVNGVPIRKYASKESNREDESLDRDLSLTWGSELPKDNEIIAGQWHADKKGSKISAVSIEQGIAENLEINLGDVLQFTVDTQIVEAEVTSIRTVEWESFTPNFYMIFNQAALSGLSATYLGSLHLDSSQRPLLKELVGKFPSATFFDVDFLLKRIRGISEKISYAIETVLYFALFASILVFLAIEIILQKYRAYSSAIFKAVGANTRLMQRVYRTQFILVGLMAGAIAYSLNLLVSHILSNYIIEGAFVFNPKTVILCLLIAPILVFCAGYISIYRMKEIPVKKLLTQS